MYKTMTHFPHVKDIDKFEQMNYDRIKNILTTDIYNLIISRKTENEYFDLDTFNMKTNVSMKVLYQMIKEIMIELEKSGWKTKLSFGDTGLFIYSTEEHPKSCW
jgi:hypothetical protein